MKYSEDQLEKMELMAKYHNEGHLIDNMVKVIEELAELTKPLCKFILFKRGRIRAYLKKEIIQELFDADFMIFQAKKYFLETLGFQEDFNKIVDETLDRELVRWGLVNWTEEEA